MENKVLLSICIPTCNRGSILDTVILNYITNEEFDDSVELVISDNASTDNTEEIVKEIIKKYPSKKISYYKNDENIGAKNFFAVISRAKGKYAKISNDYIYMTNEGLKVLKDNIRNTSEDTGLFFYDHLRQKNNGSIMVKNVDEFIHLVNNKITWVTNFGCWTKDIQELGEYTKSNPKVDDHIIQISFWALYLVDHYNKTKVVDVHWNRGLSIPNSKRALTYNFFTPHVVWYYDLINDYAKLGKVKPETIVFDKKRLLSDFVGNKIVEYLILKKPCAFDLSGSWKIVMEYFGSLPYFYYIIPITTLKLGLINPIKVRVKKLVKYILFRNKNKVNHRL